MRFLAFSDMHLHPYSGRAGSEYRKCFSDILRSAEEEGCEALVFAGDLFESPTLLDSRLLVWAEDELKRVGMPFIACSGNHDNYDLARSSTTLSLIHSSRGITGWNFPHPYSVRVKGVEFRVVHYSDDVGMMEEEIKSFPRTTTPVVLVTHQVIKGSSYRGMNTGDGLDPKVLSKGSTISIVGHVHNHQRSSDGKILVPGSPLQNNIGDIGLKRGWFIVDVDGTHVTVQMRSSTVSNREDSKRKQVQAVVPREMSKRVSGTSRVSVMGDVESLVDSYVSLDRTLGALSDRGLDPSIAKRVGLELLGGGK